MRSALYNRCIHKVFEHLRFCLGDQGPLHRAGNWWEKEREHHKCCWESHTNHPAKNILSFNCHNALWSRYYHTYFISDSQDLTNSHKVPKLAREEPGFPSSPLAQKARPSAYPSHRWRESMLIFLYNRNLKLSENILCDINYELPQNNANYLFRKMRCGGDLRHMWISHWTPKQEKQPGLLRDRTKSWKHHRQGRSSLSSPLTGCLPLSLLCCVCYSLSPDHPLALH